MGLIKTGLIMISFLVAVSATAETSVKVLGMYQASPQSSSKAIRRSPAQCTNFSGAYWGKCDSETDIRELVIYQIGCDHINIDGDGHNIGTVETRAVSAAGYTNSASQNIEWDDQADKLLLSYLGHFNFAASSGSPAFPMILSSEMSLSGNQLSIAGRFGDEKVSCSFTK